MTIIVFLVDTSASMNQTTFVSARLTLLDIAKDTVERFIKIRQRDSASRGDRYMLLTFDESPNNIKAGWKENHVTFLAELKNLAATGLSTLGQALKNAFDLLNINRMQTGIDTYGQGRCPYYLEPSVIVVITDGCKLTSTTSVQEQLNLPMHSLVPGSELTKEPFRWDQRIFGLVLRLAGNVASNGNVEPPLPPIDTSSLQDMCEVTGGRSYCITSQRMLFQCLELLVQKVQGGVVINFEKVGPDPSPAIEDEGFEDGGVGVLRGGGVNGVGDRPSPTPNCIGGFTNNNNNSAATLAQQQQAVTAGTTDDPSGTQGWQNCRRMIYVQRSAQKGYSVGHWPIPESFWPSTEMPSLSPRSAHPNVRFMCQATNPMVIDNLPFDKYELEHGPLSNYILQRRQPSVAWQVFISGSYKDGDIGLPFGYLKASTSLTCVNLFVLPYNYPVLLPLLDELIKVHRCKPTKEWRIAFDNYLANMPLYYAAPMKRALQRMGAPNLVPDNLENCLSYSVLTYLKRLKNQAKAEYDKLVSTVGGGQNKPAYQAEGLRVSVGIPRESGEVLRLTQINLTSNPALKDRFQHLRNELNDFTSFVVAVKGKEPSRIDPFRNAYDIPRVSLLDQIARMRANYFHTGTIKLQDDDQVHSLPVSEMGNYQEYLKRQPAPLRELESQPVRQHMFGNPFKIDKRMMVDEADMSIDGLQQSTPNTSGLNPSSMSGGASMRKRAYSGSLEGLSRAGAKRKPGPLPRDLNAAKILAASQRRFSDLQELRQRQSRPPSPTSPMETDSVTPPTPLIMPPSEQQQHHTITDDGMAENNMGTQLMRRLIDIETAIPVENNGESPFMPNDENSNSSTASINSTHSITSPRLNSAVVVTTEAPPTLVQCNGFVTSPTPEQRAAALATMVKLCRQPGRDYGALLRELDHVTGDGATRRNILERLILEARRFKRTHLVVSLREHAKRRRIPLQRVLS